MIHLGGIAAMIFGMMSYDHNQPQEVPELELEQKKT